MAINIPTIIDLTASPSPPPPALAHANPEYQRQPCCMGQLSVTALVLYPIPYLEPRQHHPGAHEWASVATQADKLQNNETINILTPLMRAHNGQVMGGGEHFAVVEQKVANTLAPLLRDGLIRLEGKVKRGQPNMCIIPLQFLVYTPRGNIPVVGRFLQKANLYLNDIDMPFQREILDRSGIPYQNPHNPPPGGFQRAPIATPPQQASAQYARYSASVQQKSVQVQRSHIDEVFQSLRSREDLPEATPPASVATTLYPHQKQALTFLLEREGETHGGNRIWKRNPSGHSWTNIVTQNEVFHEPKEPKSALLADDMGLGKTITCVSLIAATLPSAEKFKDEPLPPLPPPPECPEASTSGLDASHFSGAVFDMPATSQLSKKAMQKEKTAAKRSAEHYLRMRRIKVKSRGTLIVCPLSTVVNWEDQFREHWKGPVYVHGGSGNCDKDTVTSLFSSPSSSSSSSSSPNASDPGNRSLRVYVYHGNARRPDPKFLADFDAVITTYATLASEYSKQSRSLADDEDEQGQEPDIQVDDDGIEEVDMHGNPIIRLVPSGRKKGSLCGMKRKKCSGGKEEATSPLQMIHWFRVVLDEAHSIKETSTVGSRASCDLIADRRLCLTGTPVQNKLDDVYALIKFLRIEPLDDKALWTEYIGAPVKFGQTLGIGRLQTVMKCVTLRRTKESKTEKGESILKLPPRRDELRFLKFDRNEQAIYDDFFNESKAEFNELSASGQNEVMKNYVGILQKILRLRQICDHWELAMGKDGITVNRDAMALAMQEEAVASIEREGISVSSASVLFALLRETGIAQCLECGGELAAPLPLDDGTTGDCLDACASGSLANQLANSSLNGSTSKRPVKRIKSEANTRPSSPGGGAPSMQNGPVNLARPILTRCQHLFCLGCFRNGVCPAWPAVPEDFKRPCSACQTLLTLADAVEVPPDAVLAIPTGIETEAQKAQKNMSRKAKKEYQAQRRAETGEQMTFNPSTKVKALLSDLIQFSRSNPHSANYDPNQDDIHIVDSSGKVVDDGPVKTIVFSQWTTMLDKVEEALEAASIRYERLDGTMKRDERTKAMEALKHDKSCEVLLVSLKAGGVGLNLTAAQRVYLMDPYWNPAVENQAVDRIHRLGQTRPVTTVKLIIENSIEARLLEVQKKKTALANMTLAGTTFTRGEMAQRRLEELAALFEA
ncbi:hypothetical protein SISNIDRAFT_494062 [Sistotremastrum niveocremeum HHB9708]|uniref:P-loop containing nucleoside triphosphate hydrolase protein n=1 Tax=Sistotremastrum niveocremeum HHB9708 TaxID=1314777 RepID=A0A164XAA1_9AGAM|nr:hypothetical protein SISNIDRAFT_494062 [Sistotremastrum niveocremeum HHB9708]